MARLQVGIDPGNYGVSPFLNWAKLHVAPIELQVSGVPLDAASVAARMDSHNECSNTLGCNLFGFLFYVSPVDSVATVADFGGRAMVAKWSGGSAVTGITPVGISNLAVNLAGKRATFNMASGAQGNAGLLWLLDGSNGGPTGIVICEAAKESLYDGGRVMDPDFLVSTFGSWHSTRWMDAMNTNCSAATAYTDFPVLADAFWGGNQTANKYKVGWPVQVIIEYLNYNPGSIAWINIPHQFSDAAITSLLTAIRDGVNDWSTVRLKIEYSNETWNSQFSLAGTGLSTGQWDYFVTQATAASAWTGGDTGKWVGYKAAQVMEIPRTVFGTDSGTKWQGALGTWLIGVPSQTDYTRKLKIGIDRHISNDAGAASTITKLFSRLAVAGYTGVVPADHASTDGALLISWANAGNAAFIANMYNALKAGTASVGSGPHPTGNWYTNDAIRAYDLEQKTLADSYGLVVDHYEAGNHVVLGLPMRDDGTGDAVNLAMRAWGRSRERAQLDFDRWTQFIADTGGVPAGFTLLGPDSKFWHGNAYEVAGQYASEPANAWGAFNLGVPYRPGYRNVRTV